MTRQEQKEQRRQQIRMKALELFVTKGFSETKISDIAGELNISVGLLFHYYESKEQLLLELVQMGVEGTKRADQGPKDDPLAYFRIFLCSLFDAAGESPWIYQLFVLMSQAMRLGMPANIRELAMSVAQVERSVAVIEKGQAMGLIREGDPLTLSHTYWSSVQGIMEQHLITPDIPFPEPEWVLAILKAPGA